MKINNLSMLSNNAANQNEVFGRVTMSKTPVSFQATRPSYRYMNPSVRGDKRKGLLGQGKRYVE